MPLNLGAFLGGNNGQGGLMPQIQAAQKAAQARDLQAAAWQAMQAGLIPPNQGGTPPVPSQTPMSQQLPPMSGAPMPPMPGGQPSPQGMPPVPAPQAPPQGSTDPIVRQVLGSGSGSYPPMPQQPATPPAPPSLDDQAKSTPPDIMTKFMTGLAQSKMPDWQKGAAMEKFIGMYAPIAQRQEEVRWHNIEQDHYNKMDYYREAGSDPTRYKAGLPTSEGDVAPPKAPKPEKLSNDPKYQKLKSDMELARSRAVAALPKDYPAAKAAYDKAAQAVGDYENKGGGAAAIAKPTEEGATAPGQPADADVAYLKANPDQAANFDSAFGKGAAAKILGQ